MSDENKVEERGIAAVSATKAGPQSAKSKFGILVIAVVVAGALIALTWKDDEKKEEKPQIAVNTGAARGLDVAPVRQTPPVEAVEVKAAPEKPEEPQEDDMSIASRRAPIMAFRGQARQASTAGQTAVSGTAQPAGKNALQSKLTPTVLDGVQASRIANLHMTVPQGTHIPCVLETAISSDQPGFVTCIIQRDVLSASGQVVLLEKGTQVTGEYQNGVERGQKRIFVLWGRARTPTGVVVTLASPATDALGRAGFDGKIDTKFWDRFGGALLLSIVSDASAYLSDRLQDSKQTIELSSTQSSAQNAAAIAVENSINIKPTLYKNQGELVSIFVARDLDFASVYKLRRTETRNQIYDRTIDGNMHQFPPAPITK